MTTASKNNKPAFNTFSAATHGTQFIKHFPQLFETGLSTTEVLVLDYLYDRRKLGLKRKDPRFFDEDRQEYFINYSYPKMASALHLSERTIARTYKKLAAKGFITLENTPQETNYKIFITPYLVGANYYFRVILQDKVSRSPWSKCHLSQRFSQTSDKDTNNTGYTKKPDWSTPFHPVSEDQDQDSKPRAAKRKPAVRKKDTHLEFQQRVSHIDLWKSAAINKLGLPANAVETILSFVKNDHNKAASIVKLIIKARGSVQKQNHLKRSAITSFEKNENIQRDLQAALIRIFGYISQKKLKNYEGYLVTSLKGFFGEAFGLKADEPMVCPQKPKRTGQYSNHTPINEELPDWAKQRKAEEAEAAKKNQKRRYVDKILTLQKELQVKDPLTEQQLLAMTEDERAELKAPLLRRSIKVELDRLHDRDDNAPTPSAKSEPAKVIQPKKEKVHASESEKPGLINEALRLYKELKAREPLTKARLQAKNPVDLKEFTADLKREAIKQELDRLHNRD